MTSTSILRNSTSLSSENFRFWRGYKKTAGLENYRSDERYAVWMHAHRRLVESDSAYARDTRWFHVRLVGCTLLSLALTFYLPSLMLAAAFGTACAALCVCREQRRRNLNISVKLEGQL